MKFGKYLKRFFLVIGIFLILVLVALAIVPIFFKGQLLEAVRQQINENIQAKVDFKDVNLSFFRQFPNLTVGIEELAVMGLAPFDSVELARIENFEVTVDVKSLLGSGQPMQIQSIQLTKPHIHVLVTAAGLANYDIAKPSADTTAAPAESTPYEIRLKRFGITDGELIYDDRSSDMYVAAADLDLEGKAGITQDVYDLDTKTGIASLTVAMGGITYLKQALIDLTAGVEANMANNTYTLRENALRVNALLLEADGSVALLPEDAMQLDLRFKAPGSEFRELLSLIPNAYMEGYENVKVEGQFALDGEVKGVYKENQYPAFALHANIRDGQVQYPDLPMGIADIQTEISVNSPETDLDRMMIDIPTFRMRVGSSPLEGYFKLRTPLSDPDIDTRVNGVLDLDALSQAFPMEGVEKMGGAIAADVTAKTRLSTIEAEAYEQVDMKGQVEFRNLVYDMEGYPAVAVNSGALAFSPQRVEIQNVQTQLGKSDLRASGSIDNILAWFSPNKTMVGRIDLQSNHFYADEWMTESESEVAVSTSEAPAPPSESEAPFDRFDFTLTGKMGQMDYDVYEIKNIQTAGRFKPNRMEIDNFQAVLGESDFQASGVITQVWDYLFDNGVLGGNIFLKSRFLDLNPFMVADETASTPSEPTGSESYEPIEVPGNIDMTIRAEVGRIKYTDLDLNNFSGTLVVADRQVTLDNCTAKTLDGNIGVSGAYDTKDPQNPGFTFKYDLQSLNFQKTFNAFNTFQTIAPVGQYIEGKFTSTMIMEGVLGQDFVPKISSISADGFLQTISAVIKSFPPLQAVGQKLNVDYFNSVPLQNTKNWFEIRDGKVEVKDFDLKVKGIDMKVGGSHAIDQQNMNYRILAKIPREVIEKMPGGSAAESGLNALRQEAGKLGFEIEKSEFINVQFTITGSMAQPKVAMKLLGADGQTSVTETVKEEVKEEVKQQVEEVKEQAKQKVEETKQQVKDTVEQIAKEKAAEAEKEAKKKAEEILKEKTGKTEEEIKKELEEFNPFKKKKG